MPGSTTPGPSTAASTTPASTTPASTAAASTAAASTTPASTTLSQLAAVVLIAGGTLMLIGSLEPWTYGGVYNGVIVHRNGFQLANDNGFSPIGPGAWLVCYGGLAILAMAAITAPRPRRLGWRVATASILSLAVVAA